MRAARRPSVCSRTSRARSCPKAAAGGANLHTAGELAVEKVLHEAMEAAIGDRDDHAGGDLPRHRRRRSRRRGADGARHHAAHRLQVARAGRQRRADRAGGRRAGRAGHRDHRRHRIDRLRPQRGVRGGARRRLGTHDRRRGQRLLDRPRVAGGGDAGVRRPRPGDRPDRRDPGALQRRRRVAPAADRLRPRAAAGQRRGARADHRSGSPSRATRWPAGFSSARPRSSCSRRDRWRRASRCAATRSRSSWPAASFASCRGWPTSCRGGCVEVAPRAQVAAAATRSRRSARSGSRWPRRAAARACRSYKT